MQATTFLEVTHYGFASASLGKPPLLPFQCEWHNYQNPGVMPYAPRPELSRILRAGRDVQRRCGHEFLPRLRLAGIGRHTWLWTELRVPH